MRLICSSSLDLSALRGAYSAELCSLLAGLLAKPAAARPSFKSLQQSSLLQRSKSAPRPPPAGRPTTSPPLPSPCLRPLLAHHVYHVYLCYGDLHW